MTLAEQVLQLKTDFDEVYKAGKKASGTLDYDAVYGEGYEDGREAGHSAGYSEGYDAGYDVGLNSGVVDIPNPLEYAICLQEAFYKVAFPTGYELTLSIPRISNCKNAFAYSSGVATITLIGNDDERAIDFDAMFSQSADLVTIDLRQFKVKIKTASMMFYYCPKLTTILGELDFSESTNNSGFSQCRQLVNVTPKKNSINKSIGFAQASKLSAVSIQAIVDGLADLTGQIGQTLTLHGTTHSLLTDDQLLQIGNKNWSVA